MRIYVLFVVFLGFTACEEEPPKQEISKVLEALPVEDPSKYCHMTTEEFGAQYLKNQVKLKDFNLCDSLLIQVVKNIDEKPKVEQQFWFSVLSKLSPETDGYLTEIFGVVAYGFIKEKPLEFARYVLAMKRDFPVEANLTQWARQVNSEISIAFENKEISEIEKYIKNVKLKSDKSSSEEKVIIERFCSKLKSIR